MDSDINLSVTDVTPDKENVQMVMFAKLAAQVLCKAYPEHLWMVGFIPGGALVIKNMAIAEGKYGYTVDVARAGSISEVEHAVMLGGGELLERCGVRRGSWDGNFMHLQHKD
jgi:hypothetical protein